MSKLGFRPPSAGSTDEYEEYEPEGAVGSVYDLSVESEDAPAVPWWSEPIHPWVVGLGVICGVGWGLCCGLVVALFKS